MFSYIIPEEREGVELVSVVPTKHNYYRPGVAWQRRKVPYHKVFLKGLIYLHNCTFERIMK